MTIAVSTNSGKSRINSKADSTMSNSRLTTREGQALHVAAHLHHQDIAAEKIVSGGVCQRQAVEGRNDRHRYIHSSSRCITSAKWADCISSAVTMAFMQPSLQTTAADVRRIGGMDQLQPRQACGRGAVESSITSQRTSKPSDKESLSVAQISAERLLTPIRAVGICQMPARDISSLAP